MPITLYLIGKYSSDPLIAMNGDDSAHQVAFLPPLHTILDGYSNPSLNISSTVQCFESYISIRMNVFWHDGPWYDGFYAKKVTSENSSLIKRFSFFTHNQYTVLK